MRWTQIVIIMSSWQIFTSSTVQPIEMDILLFGCIWKISNEAETKSSNVCSGTSDPGGTWNLQILNWRYWVGAITYIIESVLHAVDRHFGTSIQALTFVTGNSTAHSVLLGKALHPFHVQRVQLLQPVDHPWCVAFVQWFVDQSVANMHFFSSVLFCEKKQLFHVLRFSIRTMRTHWI